MLHLAKVRLSGVGRVSLEGRAARTLYRGIHGSSLEEGMDSGPPIARTI